MSLCSILVLGLGWTGEYVAAECKNQQIDCAFTTTTGRNGSIKFSFEPRVDLDYSMLPMAELILITFPFTTLDSPELFLNGYRAQHGISPQILLLGSTRAFGSDQQLWADERGPIDSTDPRIQIENRLLMHGGSVFNLCGLYGGRRKVSNIVKLMAKSKEYLQTKKSVHFIHGADIARLVLRMHVLGLFAAGQRFIVTDLRVYDTWQLVMDYDYEGDLTSMVVELMKESNVRALPRPLETLKRALDSRSIWDHLQMRPKWSIAMDEAKIQQ
jgi:hypothetical protein